MMHPYRHTRRSLALLAGIGILIVGHSAVQDSRLMWTRSLPILLILILGELAREWTAARLSPTADAGTNRRRRRLQWLTLIVGLALLFLPFGAVELSWMSKFGVWPLVLFAAGIVCLGVSAALMLVRAQAALEAKRAEAARAGRQPAFEPPGPLALLVVVAAALILFTLINATVIKTLAAHQVMSAAQWVRVIVSVLLVAGFAILVWRKLNEFADRVLDSASLDPS